MECCFELFCISWPLVFPSEGKHKKYRIFSIVYFGNVIQLEQDCASSCYVVCSKNFLQFILVDRFTRLK